MKIKIEKGDICPICKMEIKPENGNCWVEYHISYTPKLTILACKFCNYIEYAIFNKLRLDNCNVSTMTRKYAVLQLKHKFEILKV